MPFVFIGVGVVFVLTGIKGNAGQLFELVKGDFSGPNNFIYWLLSVFALGSMGYVPQLRNLSRLFIVLVLLVLLIDNRGFFAQFQEFVNSSSSATQGATQ
jgi:hypothetical protein